MTELIRPFVNFGIIGCGNHASQLLDSFSRSEFARLSMIASTRSATRHFLEKKYPSVRVSDRYADVLDSQDVNCVLIALPNHLHAEWAKSALEAGKNILCEKPLCLTCAEATHLERLAKRRKLLLVEAFYYREHQQITTAKALISTGRIGELREIHVRYCYQLSDQTNYRFHPEFGGGALYDTGCYGIDSARNFFEGEPIRAGGRLVLSSTGLDTQAEFTLDFTRNRVARIICSMCQPRENSLRFIGSQGEIFLREAFHVLPKQKVTITVRTAGQPKEERQAVCDQFAAFIDRLARRILSGETEKGALENGVQNMRALEMVRSACTPVDPCA